MLGVPAGIAVSVIAIQLLYPSTVPSDWASWQMRWNRRILWALLVLVNLMFIAVLVLGIPFLAIMTSDR